LNKSYKDTFKGTAQYYAKYRTGYPESFFNLVKNKYTLTRSNRILDLGCGTGQIAIPISRFVKEVVAMDPEAEMLAEGKIQAEKANVLNIKWIEGGSEDLCDFGNEIGKFRLVIIGTAFHWMDRERTLDTLYEMINDGGGIIVTWLGNSENANKEQLFHTEEVIKKWLGIERRAGSGFYTQPPKRHEEVIKESKFHRIETWRQEFTLTNDVESVIGLTYSTSYANPGILGDKKEGFEKDLRETLMKQNPSGKFVTEGKVDAILAWK